MKLVLLRHGESTWNMLNKFTGWTDVGLSQKGVQEAKEAGKILGKRGFIFDEVFTSVQRRALQTTKLTLNSMNHKKVPVKKAWQLNERHYGALQGLNKAEMAAKFGEKQVHIWRRSYDVRPPALKISDKRYAAQQKTYKKYGLKKTPRTECLKDTVARVLPYWKKEIVPELEAGKKVLISAHGNSLRALVKHLENISEKEIVELNIPTGIPLVYELDKKLKPIKHYYLGDQKKINASLEKVKAQGKAK
ncbi:MAG: 2,3-diphosphoglycerate-dependent phosphoglycerate mutase [Nanoarchaeota archaeon]